MFDRALLPPADHEFVVLADTHYMRDVGDRPLEFESRRKQTARAGLSMRLAAGLETGCVIHLGDIVQEEPGSDEFPDALREALEQIAACGLTPRFVAGNHDVGDKPDRTMPTHFVTQASLDFFHERVGPSWYSFDIGDAHIVVVNSQVLNTDRPERDRQRVWLESDLAANASPRTFLFFHIPAYLGTPHDPHFGNYDVIGEPDRTWLLDLVRTHRIHTVCMAHVHFAFFDRLGDTDVYTMPSTSFTRPGFSHVFQAPAPPERGRDDVPKLGIHLFRLREDRTDVHFLRTRGETEEGPGRRPITRLATDLPDAPTGITLRRPLLSRHETPIAYPSLVRQPVRNDYPFLSLLESGIRHVRFPVEDLECDDQRARLTLLRERGVTLTATWIPTPDASLPDLDGDLVDTLEVRAPGSPLPTSEDLGTLADRLRACPCPISLAPVDPFQRVPGKQHARTRLGARPDQVAEFLERASAVHLDLDRIVVRVPTDEPGAAFASAPVPCDFALDLPGVDDLANAAYLARAVLSVAAVPGARLFVEPFIDFDRTMDIANGLLDTLCNPRPAFDVLRLMTSILYAHPVEDASVSVPDIADWQALALHTSASTFTLLSRRSPGCPLPDGFAPSGDGRLYDLLGVRVYHPADTVPSFENRAALLLHVRPV